MVKIVNTNPSKNSITGLFRRGDHVLVKCDAANSDYTIELPDASSCRDVMFFLKKVDSTNNSITYDTFSNQLIDGYV